MSLAWAVLQTGRFAFSPLLPRIVGELAISAAEAGLAMSVLQVIYAVLQYPSGQLSDQLGRATIIVPSLVLLSIGFLTVGLSMTFAMFLGGIVLVGAGKGLFASPSRALLFDLFANHRGRAIGIFTAATDVGGLVASGLAIVVLEFAVWRLAFLPVALSLMGVLGVFLYVNRESYSTEWPTFEIRHTTDRMLFDGDRRRVLVAYALFYFMVSGFITFFPLFLTTTKGFSESLASGIFSAVFVVGLMLKPLAGGLSDRFDPASVGSGGLFIAALGLLALQVVDSLSSVLVVVVVLAIGYKVQFPIADTTILETAPTETMGTDLGAARAIFLGAGSLGPVVVGAAATVFGYSVAFVGLAVCLLLSAWTLARADL